MYGRYYTGAATALKVRYFTWAGQRSKGDDPVEFVGNLLGYWQEDYTDNPIHPTHDKPRKRRKRR